MISGSWDGVPCPAPLAAWSLLEILSSPLPLPHPHHILSLYLFLSLFLKILFIYLTERESAQTGGVGKGEAGSTLSREPDVGLDPRTPRS